MEASHTCLVRQRTLHARNATRQRQRRRVALVVASGMVDEQEPYGRARADVWPTNEESVGILQAFAKRGGGGSSNGGPRWLAAIISANVGGTRFQTASHSASVVGFAVEHIPAATPAQYSGKRAMVQDLFGAADQQSVMISMTPFEIALLISHKRALRAIAASSYSWGAVFEDDAYLHEAVPPAHAKHLLAAAFAAADAAAARPLPPVLYIAKLPAEMPFRRRAPKDAIATGMSDALLRVGKCEAFCTHAYALSRRRAATFFDDVFDCREGGRGCASECDLWPCYMDWAMMRYFERAGEAWIVGGGFRGRWKRGHRGLFIQNRSLAAQGGAKVGRSGLAKSFRWTTVSNDSAILEEQACERNEMNVSRPKVPLQKLRITIDFQGRLGNLMFEVAMLAGMLRRLRRLSTTPKQWRSSGPRPSSTPPGKCLSNLATCRSSSRATSGLGAPASSKAPKLAGARPAPSVSLSAGPTRAIRRCCAG